MGADCDDANAGINPDAVEVCDSIDNNCDGASDEGFDVDGDGYTSCGGDCDDGDGGINPSAAETCDGIDNNCDGNIDIVDARRKRLVWEAVGIGRFASAAASLTTRTRWRMVSGSVRVEW